MAIANTMSDSVKSLRNQDFTLKMLYLYGRQYSDRDVNELVNCLIRYPNAVENIDLGHNQLTDKTGIKLAYFVMHSTTIRVLDLRYNRCDKLTYLAMSKALHFNSSLSNLYLKDNRVMEKNGIDGLFINALIINPYRPIGSYWSLYDVFRMCNRYLGNDFDELNDTVKALGHPNMQSLLIFNLYRRDIPKNDN